MAKPKEGLTEKFTSFLSFKLGAYQGLGLYENYPTNFNKLMPKFATDLLAQLHALGYKSPDEIPAIERVAMERGKEECAKTHFKPDWKIGAQEIKDATEEGVRAGILIGGADKVPDMIKEVERAAMEKVFDALREAIAREFYAQAQQSSKLLSAQLHSLIKNPDPKDFLYVIPLEDWEEIKEPTLKQIWLIRADQVIEPIKSSLLGKGDKGK